MASQPQRYDNKERIANIGSIDSLLFQCEIPMRKDSEITAIPPEAQRVSSNLRWSGWICFWVQIVLGVISTLALLLAVPSLLGNDERSQGTGVGVFFAICGLITLGVCIYYSFRYTNIAKLLNNPNPAIRPKKADTIKVIRIGLTTNILGLLFSIMGTQAVVGSVLVKSLQQSPGLGVGGASARFVLPVDMFSIQANTTAITAYFVGIVTSLWLLNRITR
ncbi:Protein of unknown function (DUF3611) [Pleurocapsa sp. PCC 7327]|nr:Protein of unknown function (DUF3611) [Pleurocapsa sp. PCC 7327]